MLTRLVAQPLKQFSDDPVGGDLVTGPGYVYVVDVDRLRVSTNRSFMFTTESGLSVGQSVIEECCHFGADGHEGT